MYIGKCRDFIRNVYTVTIGIALRYAHYVRPLASRPRSVLRGRTPRPPPLDTGSAPENGSAIYHGNSYMPVKLLTTGGKLAFYESLKSLLTAYLDRLTVRSKPVDRLTAT